MITTTMLNNFRKDLNAALEPLTKKYGLNIEAGKITYSLNDFSLKLTATDVKEAMDKGISPEKAIWDANCRLYGLNEDDFNKEINLTGKMYRIAGILPNCRKNGILIEDINTKTQYKTSYETARNAIMIANLKTNKKTNANATS